ncbi:MAG: GatB/YqeY domain-containing protein [Dehalococcoidia bacterium]
MSALQQQVQDQLKQAMRDQDAVERSTLRMLIAAFKNAEIEAGTSLSDEHALAVVQKQAKQRRESIEEFKKAGRQDLVDQETAELVVLERFLPAQATDEDIRAAAQQVITETGAAGPREIGKVMPVLTASFAGRADGRRISAIVRELLGS